LIPVTSSVATAALAVAGIANASLDSALQRLNQRTWYARWRAKAFLEDTRRTILGPHDRRAVVLPHVDGVLQVADGMLERLFWLLPNSLPFEATFTPPEKAAVYVIRRGQEWLERMRAFLHLAKQRGRDAEDIYSEVLEVVEIDTDYSIGPEILRAALTAKAAICLVLGWTEPPSRGPFSFNSSVRPMASWDVGGPSGEYSIYDWTELAVASGRGWWISISRESSG